jgi:uncharacterized protein YndB with AHSA1/START domain
MSAKNKTNEIKLHRVYDAPVKLVWEAWTDVNHVAKWWGPRGFTLTTHSKELKPGGIWHYTMHGPDGTDYPNKTLYHEVEKYAKLVYDHGGYDERKPLFKVTVYFKEVGKKTHMDMTMAFETPEICEQMGKFIKQAGGNSTWDRLAEYLDKETEGKDKFVINRSFNASIDLMFKMWTDPEHFSKWLPPTGMNMTFLKGEIREGSSMAFFMSNDEGFKFYGNSKYLEIKKPETLVYTQQFTDENGKVSKHPGALVWPETLLVKVQLTVESPDQTRVTVSMEPFGHATPEEIAAFVKERGGMTMGWTGSFDKLETLLAN